MKFNKNSIASILFILGMILLDGYRGYVFLAMIGYGFYMQREYMMNWYYAIKARWDYKPGEKEDEENGRRKE